MTAVLSERSGFLLQGFSGNCLLAGFVRSFVLHPFLRPFARSFVRVLLLEFGSRSDLRVPSQSFLRYVTKLYTTIAGN
jgi:hypothetical protein